MIVQECFLELRTGYRVIVALPPGSSVVGVVDRDRLEFGVVVAKVNDDFGEAGLQVADRAR